MSAEKTLEIIDLFNYETRELSVQQIAILLNSPQSSVYRHLKILKEKGYVVETSLGNYKLGYRFLQLAKYVKSDINLSSIAFPVMKNLSTKLGETIILTIPTEYSAVCLEVVTPDKAIKVASEQGKILPLHAGASTKTLLAYMPDDTLEQLSKRGLLHKYTETTKTSVEEIQEDMKVTRERGYSYSDSEVDEGVIAYGVPIHDMDNHLIAALSIAGPSERMKEVEEQKIIEQLFDAKEEIEHYF